MRNVMIVVVVLLGISLPAAGQPDGLQERLFDPGPYLDDGETFSKRSDFAFSREFDTPDGKSFILFIHEGERDGSRYTKAVGMFGRTDTERYAILAGNPALDESFANNIRIMLFDPERPGEGSNDAFLRPYRQCFTGDHSEYGEQPVSECNDDELRVALLRLNTVISALGKERGCVGSMSRFEAARALPILRRGTAYYNTMYHFIRQVAENERCGFPLAELGTNSQELEQLVLSGARKEAYRLRGLYREDPDSRYFFFPAHFLRVSLEGKFPLSDILTDTEIIDLGL